MQRMYDYRSGNNYRMYNNIYRQNESANTDYVKKCNIQPVGRFPECTAIAMAYIPFQENNDIYDDCQALERGTAFPCLDKPFMGGCQR